MKRSFIKDLFSVGFSNIFIIILNISVSIITARTLGPDKNGIIASLLVYPSLFMSIGSLGLRQSTTYLLGKGIFKENDIKKAITQIWLFTTVFSLFCCYYVMYFFSNATENNHFYIFLAVLPIPFSLFNTYNSGIFLGKNDIVVFNKINWLAALIVFLVSFVLLVLFKGGVLHALIALCTGPFILFLILLFKNRFFQSFTFNIDFNIIKSMISLGAVYALALLVINLNYKLDIIILDKLSTAYEMGIYSKGVGITQYLWQIPMVISTLVFARSAVSKDDYKFSLKVAQLLRISFVIIGIASLVLFLISKVLVTLMFGVDFIESSLVIRTLIPGVIILTLFKVMNMDLAGKGKPWVALKAMLPALVFNILFNIYWIPKYGAFGASLASTISYSVAGLLFIYVYSKETGLSLKQIFGYSKRDFDPIINVFKKIKS